MKSQPPSARWIRTACEQWHAQAAVLTALLVLGLTIYTFRRSAAGRAQRLGQTQRMSTSLSNTDFNLRLPDGSLQFLTHVSHMCISLCNFLLACCCIVSSCLILRACTSFEMEVGPGSHGCSCMFVGAFAKLVQFFSGSSASLLYFTECLAKQGVLSSFRQLRN